MLKNFKDKAGEFCVLSFPDSTTSLPLSSAFSSTVALNINSIAMGYYYQCSVFKSIINIGIKSTVIINSSINIGISSTLIINSSINIGISSTSIIDLVSAELQSSTAASLESAAPPSSTWYQQDCHHQQHHQHWRQEQHYTSTASL